MIPADILQARYNITGLSDRSLPEQPVGITISRSPVVRIGIRHRRNKLILKTLRHCGIFIYNRIEGMRSTQQIGIIEFKRYDGMIIPGRRIKIIGRTSPKRDHPKKIMSVEQIRTDLKMGLFSPIPFRFHQFGNQ